MKSLRDIRVIPVVLVAVFGLAVLKVAGLVLEGGYVFDYRPNSGKASWAQETFNFPGAPKSDPSDVTGSVHGAPKEAPRLPGGRRRRGLRACELASASARSPSRSRCWCSGWCW